ncbi:MAG: hypothetical protein JNK82_35405 [Myxococcaceae bacterium]|nr:hypothetical protein [Myxococcaceae bacterium]
MPLPISDRKLSDAYRLLESSQARVDDAKALELLSHVGDGRGYDGKSALAKLKGFSSRDEQVDFIKKGMTAGEKKDLVAILDKGTLQLDPGARQLIEAILDRNAPQPIGGPITLVGSQANGLAGVALPGDVIEAINISAAPAGRLHMDEGTVVATAGADGRFSAGKLLADQAIKEGDLIRMRAKHADGSYSDWVTAKATGIAPKDTRNAEVALFRIGAADAGGGKVDITNINASRQISEPGAKLQFTNVRTGEKSLVTIDANGSFPAGFKVNGKAGDSFSVAATDGVNNVDFAISVGKVTVPGVDSGVVDLIRDPAPLDEHKTYDKKRFEGPLFKEGVTIHDAVQGQIGDCYFPAAISAIANHNPDLLKNMVKDNGDGTYTVTFKERDPRTYQFRDVKIDVDGDLYARSWGGPIYGSGKGDRGEKTMELWFPLVEKAYAQWKGSYETIGNGGMASDVMQDVMGKDGRDMWISEGNQAQVWTTLKRALDGKQPVAAGTYGETQAARYTNTGVYANHAYSVVGYEEVNGEKFVQLRNPWGESEPAGNGPNDGVFKLKLAEFSRLYQTLMYTNP